MPTTAFSARFASSKPSADPFVVPEIELPEIALQVVRADVVVGALQPALQDREVALDRVRVPEAAADVLLDRVVDGAMPGNSYGDRRVDRALRRS